MKKILLTLVLLINTQFAQAKEQDKEKFSVVKNLPTECKKFKDDIPSYFPNMVDEDNAVFNGTCNKEKILLILGFGKDCEGQNVCGIASFSSQKLISNFLVIYPEQPVQPFYFKQDENDEDIIGYYTPPVCYSYCNQAKLSWIEKGVFYQITRKFADRDELIESAKSIKNLSKVKN